MSEGRVDQYLAQKKVMKRFLYLIQGKGEPSENLSKLYGEDNDIIFLSWGKPAKGSIFFPFSTWTEGRNRLYQETLDKDYLYYIFMDEDVYLKTTDVCKKPDKNPWRIFEEYLLEYEPAVGTPFFFWHKRSMAEIDTIFSFDLIVNAIHKEALPILLPYYDSDDEESWWYSGLYLVHLASLIYPSHTLQFNAITSVNVSKGDNPHKDNTLYPHAQDWNKVNFAVKSFIVGEGLKKRFCPHPASIKLSNGEVRKKDKSYNHTREDLARLFDLNAPFWRRKFELTENIASKKTHAVSKKKLPYLGEYLNRRFGPTIASFFISQSIILSQIKKRIVFFLCKEAYMEKVCEKHKYSKIFWRYFSIPICLARKCKSVITELYKKCLWFLWIHSTHLMFNFPERRQLESFRAVGYFLNRLETDTINIIDVGCGIGDFLDVFTNGSPICKKVFSIGIDPLIDTMKSKHFLREKLDVYSVALDLAITDRPEGVYDYYNYGMDYACSSLTKMRVENITHDKTENGKKIFYPWLMEEFKGIKSVKAVRLSTIMKQYKLENEIIHFLKVDTQGTDLNVFLSLGKYIRNCLFVQIETIDCHPDKILYEGQATLNEARPIIENFGFRIFNIARFPYGPEADVIFVNKKLFNQLSKIGQIL